MGVERRGPGRLVAVVAEQLAQLGALVGEPVRVLVPLVEELRGGAPPGPPGELCLLGRRRGPLLGPQGTQDPDGGEVGLDPFAFPRRRKVTLPVRPESEAVRVYCVSSGSR
ncbi:MULTISPECIES: hypothetical protein [Micromonospora]|uniref:hypothetical protein n=1 Tax=Micromonospora TaxID=1873 RepID=UPI000C8881B8|nr:hypothetical protein [Verrucosispora sp. ts21]PMR61337.1 hypothetical protein C1A38_09370 [Verrucosispora sp. ts21]